MSHSQNNWASCDSGLYVPPAALSQSQTCVENLKQFTYMYEIIRNADHANCLEFIPVKIHEGLFDYFHLNFSNFRLNYNGELIDTVNLSQIAVLVHWLDKLNSPDHFGLINLWIGTLRNQI